MVGTPSRRMLAGRRGRRWMAPLAAGLFVIAAGVGATVFIGTLRGAPAVVGLSSSRAVENVSTDAVSPVTSVPKAKADRIGDWNLICPASPTDRCYAQQQLLTNDGSHRVAGWILEYDLDARYHATWRVPPGVALDKGASISAGNGATYLLPFATCSAGYCEIRAVLDPTYLSRIVAAPEVKIGVTLKSGQKNLQMLFGVDGLGEVMSRLAAAENRSVSSGSVE